MTEKYHVRTLRLKIYPFGEGKKIVKDRVYQISNDAWKAANWIASGQSFNDTLIRRLYARRKIDAKNDKIGVEQAERDFKDVFGTKRQATTERDIKEMFPNIPPCVTNPLNQVVVSSYNKEKSDMLMGKRSLRSYKQGMPFTTTKTAIVFFEDKDKHGIQWKLNREERLHFYIAYGRDKGNYRETITKILNNELDYAAPQIQVKKNNFYLLLPVKDAQQEIELDPSLSVGVDIGVAIPAYTALSEGKARRAIGSSTDFLRTRLQFQRRAKNLQKNLRFVSGGHGREKKLQAKERMTNKERNFAKTYNHSISRNVVDFAIKNKAGVIKLEFLKGFSREEPDGFILRNWSYFELQTMIEYKAKRVGITVVKVDPYHTSQICSQCGHYATGQRNKQNFTCANCGEKLHADYNAALNIARSTNTVTKKEQCQYYKVTKAAA